MFKKLKRTIAVATTIATISATGLKTEQAKANPALVAAPAVCGTGVGCVLVGTAVVGMGIVYIWKNLKTGERYETRPLTPTPMPSRIFQSQDYNVPGRRESHFATTSAGCNAMLKRFQNEGRRLTLRRIMPVKGGVLCIFEGPDADPSYYDENRYKQ